MAYVLNALIARTGTLIESPIAMRSASLPLDLQLFPLTTAFWKSLGGRSLPLIREVEARGAPDEEFEQAGEREASIGGAVASGRSLFALVGRLSSSCSIAYLEADFWGGAGRQGGAVWRDGALIWGPAVDDQAIHHALRHLGVGGDGADAFAALQLGRHRSTEQWGR
jgi:hypothetical protein